MTSNQLSFWRNQEEQRHNLELEQTEAEKRKLIGAQTAVEAGKLSLQDSERSLKQAQTELAQMQQSMLPVQTVTQSFANVLGPILKLAAAFI